MRRPLGHPGWTTEKREREQAGWGGRTTQAMPRGARPSGLCLQLTWCRAVGGQRGQGTEKEKSEFEGQESEDSQRVPGCLGLPKGRSLLRSEPAPGSRMGAGSPRFPLQPRQSPSRSRPGCQLLTQTSPQSPKLRVLQRTPHPKSPSAISPPQETSSAHPLKSGPWGDSCFPCLSFPAPTLVLVWAWVLLTLSFQAPWAPWGPRPPLLLHFPG